MLFFWILTCLAEIIEQCEIPDTKKTLLTKYYRQNCPFCTRIEPLIDQIDSVLERNNEDVLVRYVDCDACDCKKEGIYSVPSLAVHENGVQKDKFYGATALSNYVQFVVKNIGVSEKIFYKHEKSVPGKVVKLKEMDFEEGFDGPWMILFYSNKDNEMRKLLGPLAEMYKNRINVAEINSKRSDKIRNRMGIHEGPALVGMYKGVFVTFVGRRDANDLIAFAEKLIEPSFELVDSVSFKEKTSNLGPQQPVFVVFYSDLGLANYYFKKIAHENKFKTKILKTGDKALFERAGIRPKPPVRGEKLADEEKVILTVYKNRMFHKCPHELSDTKAIMEWIFLSNFPHLTKVTVENFVSIFYGLKPAFMLITRNGELSEELEKVSANHHLGLPYADFLFCEVDLDTFPLLITKLLPNISHPALVVYDPLKQLFYHRKAELTQANFENIAVMALRDHQTGKLPSYPPRTSHVAWYLSVGVVLSGILCLVIRTRTHTKKD